MHGVTLPNRGPGSHAFISGQRDKATVMQALCEDPFSLFQHLSKVCRSRQEGCEITEPGNASLVGIFFFQSSLKIKPSACLLTSRGCKLQGQIKQNVEILCGDFPFLPTPNMGIKHLRTVSSSSQCSPARQNQQQGS
jgi:hypothetical protein